MPKLIHLYKSTDGKHKYEALFKQDNGRTKTVKFGAKNMQDYTLFNANERDNHKTLYLARHSARENWNDPMTAGSLSRWILWNKSTIEESLTDYRHRFNL